MDGWGGWVKREMMRFFESLFLFEGLSDSLAAQKEGQRRRRSICEQEEYRACRMQGEGGSALASKGQRNLKLSRLRLYTHRITFQSPPKDNSIGKHINRDNHRDLGQLLNAGEKHSINMSEVNNNTTKECLPDIPEPVLNDPRPAPDRDQVVSAFKVSVSQGYRASCVTNQGIGCVVLTRHVILFRSSHSNPQETFHP